MYKKYLLYNSSKFQKMNKNNYDLHQKKNHLANKGKEDKSKLFIFRS